jgi:hypothetical protein
MYKPINPKVMYVSELEYTRISPKGESIEKALFVDEKTLMSCINNWNRQGRGTYTYFVSPTNLINNRVKRAVRIEPSDSYVKCKGRPEWLHIGEQTGQYCARISPF